MHKLAILGGEPRISHLLPIVRPHLPQYHDMAPKIADIIATGALTKGKHLEKFELAAATVMQVKHVVGVSSCTIGLMLTYQALGLEGEVIVPSFTFMATVSSLMLCGLTPVFADVVQGTTNLDPAKAEEAVTDRTCAIVAVHNFGNPAETEQLQALADKRGLEFICDAAHALGSRRQQVPIGGQASAQCFSLSPTKLVIAGEGGLVATNDDQLAETLRIGREYGHSQNYDSAFPGLNGRLAEFNAILGWHSLQMLEPAVVTRNRVAAIYRQRLSRLPGVSFQQIDPQDTCSFKDFAIILDSEAFGLSRNALALALKQDNVDTRAYYDPPAHRQTAYRHLAPAWSLPNTESLSDKILCLPIWSDMSEETAHAICDIIDAIHENAPGIKRKLGKVN